MSPLDSKAILALFLVLMAFTLLWALLPSMFFFRASEKKNGNLRSTPLVGHELLAWRVVTSLAACKMLGLCLPVGIGRDVGGRPVVGRSATRLVGCLAGG